MDMDIETKETRLVTKFNSTSTIFSRSTLWRPNTDELMYCVCTTLFVQILENQNLSLSPASLWFAETKTGELLFRGRATRKKRSRRKKKHKQRQLVEQKRRADERYSSSDVDSDKSTGSGRDSSGSRRGRHRLDQRRQSTRSTTSGASSSEDTALPTEVGCAWDAQSVPNQHQTSMGAPPRQVAFTAAPVQVPHTIGHRSNTFGGLQPQPRHHHPQKQYYASAGAAPCVYSVAPVPRPQYPTNSVLHSRSGNLNPPATGYGFHNRVAMQSLGVLGNFQGVATFAPEQSGPTRNMHMVLGNQPMQQPAACRGPDLNLSNVDSLLTKQFPGLGVGDTQMASMFSRSRPQENDLGLPASVGGSSMVLSNPELEDVPLQTITRAHVSSLRSVVMGPNDFKVAAPSPHVGQKRSLPSMGQSPMIHSVSSGSLDSFGSNDSCNYQRQAFVTSDPYAIHQQQQQNLHPQQWNVKRRLIRYPPVSSAPQHTGDSLAPFPDISADSKHQQPISRKRNRMTTPLMSETGSKKPSHKRYKSGVPQSAAAVTSDSDSDSSASEESVPIATPSPEVVADCIRQDMPTLEEIYEFFSFLFRRAQFRPECIIMSLVLTQRLVARKGVPLAPATWRPIIAVTLLVAQKVYDDKCIPNQEFAKMLPTYTAADVSSLERKFLQAVEYDVYIASRVYAEFYFELRTISEQQSTNSDFMLRPLTRSEAKQLEERSMKFSRDEKRKQARKRARQRRSYDVEYSPRSSPYMVI